VSRTAGTLHVCTLTMRFYPNTLTWLLASMCRSLAPYT
jgi:hypothetical protein